MHLFISWSGERSKKAAEGLRSLLEDTFHLPDGKVFMSSYIYPGENWAQRIGAELEQSDFGVLCLTQDNFQSPWLLFEAGAIAKKVGSARLVPYLIDQLPPGAERSPLVQFQHVRADREGTYQLVKAIAAAEGRPEQNLERYFREVVVRS